MADVMTAFSERSTGFPVGEFVDMLVPASAASAEARTPNASTMRRVGTNSHRVTTESPGIRHSSWQLRFGTASRDRP